jgi:hypothetical protein
MSKQNAQWKKGRGKLGVFAPLMGSWEAAADSPMGPLKCTRTFAETLSGKYIKLDAAWHFGKGAYVETAMYGVNADGDVVFWSFTSDGKNSSGKIADVSDLHPDAVGFQAQMPAGLARMAYWPDDDGGCIWVVESKNKKGWHRFTEHHYRRVAVSEE